MSPHTDTSAPPDADSLFSSEIEPTDAPSSSGNANMVDERNADSVLFQLDQLATPATSSTDGQDMLSRVATPQNTNQGQGKPPGSGLIDLKTLMSGTQQAEPAASDSLVSSTTLVGEQNQRLSSSPSVSTQAPAQQPVAAPSRTPMIILSVLAFIAVIAVVAAVLVRG